MNLYCCYYHPVGRTGAPTSNEDGKLPSVHVLAAGPDEARAKAFAAVKAPIAEIERVAEDVAAVEAAKPKPKAKRTPRAKPVHKIPGVMTGDVFAATKGGSHA